MSNYLLYFLVIDAAITDDNVLIFMPEDSFFRMHDI